PESNPALGKYQDESECFPLAESWYSVYRNYEFDPVLGGTEKCVSDFETLAEVNGAFPTVFKIGNETVNTLVTLDSSEGYTAKNVVYIRPVEGNSSVVLYIAYLDCKKCVLLRNVYVDDAACSLLVPKSELGHHSICCDFVFDLLCGAGEKYILYDDSCK
ncbi:unnamed protein product, partial [Ixodes pacificus]